MGPILEDVDLSKNSDHVQAVSKLFGLSKDLIVEHNLDPYMSLTYTEFLEFLLRVCQYNYHFDNFPDMYIYDQIMMHEDAHIQIYELLKRHLYPAIGALEDTLVGKAPKLSRQKFQAKLKKLKKAGYVIPGEEDEEASAENTKETQEGAEGTNDIEDGIVYYSD